MNLSVALRSLAGHWQRATLSALGVMVGAVAIVLLTSIATGIKSDITGQVSEIGIQVLVVIPGRIEDGTFNPNLGGESYLKEEDATALAKAKGVLRTAPWSFVGGGIRNGKKTATSILIATTANWFDMHATHVQEGRVLNPADDLSDVCVIGSVAKESLFGSGTSLGKKVDINQHKYVVVGVTEDKKSEQSLFSMGGFQNLVYVPYHGLKKLHPDLQTHRVMVQMEPTAEPRALIKSLDAILAKRLDRQQFQVLTQEDLLGLVYKLMGIVTWLLTGLTSIALFVGGIGIMAIMLMSVNERSVEIGIRKTVGAKRSDIFTQFLAESVFVSTMGVLAAILISLGAIELIKSVSLVRPMMTPGILGLTFGFSIAVGIVFGTWPALAASRLDPVECFRRQ